MRIRLLLVLAATLLAAPAAAQSAGMGAPAEGGSAWLDAGRPLPVVLAPSSSVPVRVELNALAPRRRPLWLLPVIGAGVGLLAGYLADTGCKPDAICIPPPLLGVVYGAAAGLLVEAVL